METTEISWLIMMFGVPMKKDREDMNGTSGILTLKRCWIGFRWKRVQKEYIAEMLELKKIFKRYAL